MYRLQDRLSPRIFGFLPQRCTHHCLVDLYSRLSCDSVVAFMDLKSAFDVATREIILDQLVDFGVKSSLLQWIRGYLSNRISRVFISLHEVFSLVHLKWGYRVYFYCYTRGIGEGGSTGRDGDRERGETHGPRGSQRVPACFGSVSLPVECLSCPGRLVVPL